jgi:hypothetical protein
MAVVVAIAGAALVTSPARARDEARLLWKSGQVLVYRVEHDIQVSEVVGTEKSASKSRLSVTKRWQVADVDTSGVATLQLTLLRLRSETTRPDGEVLIFDSADPKPAEGLAQLSRYVGPVLAVLRVDATGKVVEVKESKFGPASRYQSELPFVGMLPTSAALKSGTTWDRSYEITVEPPQGTGEKYPTVQHYRCTGVAGSLVTVALTTELKSQPEAAGDRVPLAQSLPAGEIVYDVRAGRMHSANLKVDQEVKGFQEVKGQPAVESSYHFVSSYSEQYVGDR